MAEPVVLMDLEAVVKGESACLDVSGPSIVSRLSRRLWLSKYCVTAREGWPKPLSSCLEACRGGVRVPRPKVCASAFATL